jgi:hypothetical protein
MTLFWSRFDSFDFFLIYSAYNAVFTEVYHAVLNIVNIYSKIEFLSVNHLLLLFSITQNQVQLY